MIMMVNYNEIRWATWGPSNLYGTCPPLCAGTLPVGKRPWWGGRRCWWSRWPWRRWWKWWWCWHMASFNWCTVSAREEVTRRIREVYVQVLRRKSKKVSFLTWTLLKILPMLISCRQWVRWSRENGTQGTTCFCPSDIKLLSKWPHPPIVQLAKITWIVPRDCNIIFLKNLSLKKC